MRQTTLLTFLGVLLLTITGCGRVGISSAPTASSTSVGTTSSSVAQALPITTPVSAIKGWKVYVDDKYNFAFSYPPSLVITGYSDKNNLFLDDKKGKHVIAIDTFVTYFTGDLEEGIKSWAGEYKEDKITIVNTLLEKVVDTKDTLGFLSRWNITRYGKFSQEIKAQFESMLETTVSTPSGETKNGLIFEAQPNSISLDLFRRIVSTVRFYR